MEIPTGFKIGLSLSCCIRDILAGDVALEDVVAIVCGTSGLAHNPESAWEHYSTSFWRKYSFEEYLKVWDELNSVLIESRQLGITPQIARGHWISIEAIRTDYKQ